MSASYVNNYSDFFHRGSVKALVQPIGDCVNVLFGSSSFEVIHGGEDEADIVVFVQVHHVG